MNIPETVLNECLGLLAKTEQWAKCATKERNILYQ